MPLDVSDREVVDLRCDRCDREYARVVVFAKRNGDAYAVVSAVCHGHIDNEVWLDATFGSWAEPFADHFTMSCRITTAGAGAVDALVASRGDANYYGRLLTRAETLAHPHVGEMWELVDLVATTIPEAVAALTSA
ncbi:MAG: hypothetical protein QOJ00_976 [Actinomycetota bacterium]|jgi:hypothetical protein